LNLALEVGELTCIRGQRVLFRALSFSVRSGALLCVEGPNGAGKTSLLRLIAGLLKPAAGTICLHTDAGTVTDSEERGEFVGWLGHLDAVKLQMTVREQLSFFAQIYQASQSSEAALAAFGLTALAGVPGQFLSAGQKRRLALARLMLCGRPLWLLDEPLAALDAAGKTLVAESIRAHCACGGVALAATHEPLGLPCETLRLGAMP
jgi:heme exporter protein A